MRFRSLFGGQRVFQLLHPVAEILEHRRQRHDLQVLFIRHRFDLGHDGAQGGQFGQLFSLMVRNERKRADHMIDGGERFQPFGQLLRFRLVPGGDHGKVAGVFLAPHQLVGVLHRLQPLGLEIHQVVVEAHGQGRVEADAGEQQRGGDDGFRIGKEQVEARGTDCISRSLIESKGQGRRSF